MYSHYNLIGDVTIWDQLYQYMMMVRELFFLDFIDYGGIVSGPLLFAIRGLIIFILPATAFIPVLGIIPRLGTLTVGVSLAVTDFCERLYSLDVPETGISGIFWSASDFIFSPLGAWLIVEDSDGSFPVPFFLIGGAYVLIAVFIWKLPETVAEG